MGDCIMAWWNYPIPCEDHRTKALLAGQAIEKEAKIIAEEYQAKGLPKIAVGTGISTGSAIVGGMGSELRMDLSVIGDAVNLGARLEGQTRNYEANTLFP
jgi:adenylate cyclase